MVDIQVNEHPTYLTPRPKRAIGDELEEQSEQAENKKTINREIHKDEA